MPHILTMIVLYTGSTGFSQEAINPFVAYESIEEQIGILPDNPSYYIINTLYNHDTLTNEWVSETFHNYGDLRVSIVSDFEDQGVIDRIVTLRKINDTYSLQTEQVFENIETRTDSTFIYKKDGKIHKVVEHKYKGWQRTTEFAYEQNNMVHKHTNDKTSGETDLRFFYEGARLMKIERAPDSLRGKTMTTYSYSDTLITVFYQEIGSLSNSHVQSIYRSDANGNIIFWETFVKRKNDTDFKSSMKISYDYGVDGSYSKIIDHFSIPARNEIYFQPGIPSVTTTIWPIEKQRLVQKKFPTFYGKY